LNCLNSGLDSVSLLTQYQREELHSYIRESWSQLWIDSGRQPLVCLPPVSGKRYRGTADAVFQNIQILESNKPELVLILSGDHIYEMDYRELIRRHMETEADLTIATVEHPLREASHFGVVEVDETFRVTGFQEKPAEPRPMPSKPSMALVSMGVYVFKTDVLTRTLHDHCGGSLASDFGHHIIPSLIPSVRTYAYDFRHEETDSPCYWRDIGTLDSFYESNMDLVRSRAQSNSNHRIVHSVVSPGCHIEGSASVEHSVLMPGVTIGKNAWVRRAIVEDGVHIPDFARVGFDLEHDRQRYMVTNAGVVVVTITRRQFESPIVMRTTKPNTKRSKEYGNQPTY
jgi:glucose-1-phosphate adenylyltransferase